MAVSVVMPALEMAQETGKLLVWRKKEGERVTKGEALLEVETDKAVVEVEAPGDGILASITAHEGAVIPVGQTIAWLVQPGEALPADESRSPAARFGAESRQSAITNHSANRNPQSALSISPKARRLAKEQGIDLATVTGSGPGGEILTDDVLAAGKSRVSSPNSEVSTASRLMAERTTLSWTTVPHFFLSREVDATALNAARDAARGVSHTDLLVSRVAGALAKHPRMNASWAANAVRTHREINVAIAIAVDDAVVTGVIHGADRLSLTAVASRRRELAARARAGKLQPADIAGATFTISNLGMYQVDAFTAIIVPPQAGILAAGAIADRVVAVNGQPVVRPTLTLTLCCDHRVVDGASGAAFLNDLVHVIEHA